MGRLGIFSKLVLLFIGAYILLLPSSVAAGTRFTLVAPTEPAGGFKTGDTIKFTVNVDTQGETVYSTQVGINYQSQYIQFQTTTAGNTFTSITSSADSTGGLLVKGSSSSGFSGTGVYSYVDFKIVATAPGSTQLCSLYAPSATPTVAPTTPIVSTGTPLPTSVQPTVPVPTALPQTGSFEQLSTVALVGLVLISFRFILMIKP
ncbi:MAG: cohesin domain-containing protein [bacterium]|nr:cohesin domain-containing protein [bacterium]